MQRFSGNLTCMMRTVLDIWLPLAVIVGHEREQEISCVCVTPLFVGENTERVVGATWLMESHRDGIS